MGAGRRIRIAQSLRVGDRATRTAEVAAILPKQARTGFITVLTMRHTIRRGDELIAVEEFDAIYREAVTPGRAERGGPAGAGAAGRCGVAGGEAPRSRPWCSATRP